MKKPKLDSKGQGMTEYLILVMLVAVSSIAITTSVGKIIVRKFKVVRDQITKNVKNYDPVNSSD